MHDGQCTGAGNGAKRLEVLHRAGRCAGGRGRLGAFTVGTWELVNPDADWSAPTDDHYASWCAVRRAALGILAAGTDAGQALEWPEWGRRPVRRRHRTRLHRKQDGTVSTVDAFWLVDRREMARGASQHPGHDADVLHLRTVLSGSDASGASRSSGSERSGMLGHLVFGGVSFLANCGDILADSAVADAQVDSMEVYGEVTRLRTYNHVSSRIIPRSDSVAEYRRCAEKTEVADSRTVAQPWRPAHRRAAASTPRMEPTSSGVAPTPRRRAHRGVVVGVEALAAIALGRTGTCAPKGGAGGPRW